MAACALSAPIAADSSRPGFEKLLQEAGLTFMQPESFASIEVTGNALFPFEHAIRRDDNVLQVNYSIRPLSRISIDYEDPHNSAPEPNHIFTMMFTALIGQLSSGGATPHREYSANDAKEKFNADWAALSVFDVEPAYSNEYQQAFLVALHKNNLSDAYLVILFNDYNEIKPHLDSVFSSLRFN